jgi:hypothetical protein
MRWELQNAAYQIQCERFSLLRVQAFTTQLPQLQTIHKLSQTEGVQSLPVVVWGVHRTISPAPDNRNSWQLGIGFKQIKTPYRQVTACPWLQKAIDCQRR